MKHLLIAVLMCTALTSPLVSCRNSQARETGFRETQLRNEIRNVRGEDGVDVVYVNGFLISAARTVAGIAMLKEDSDNDDELRSLLKFCRNVKSLIVVDYEDASASVASAFNDNLDSIFNGEALLLECCDEGDKVRIYAGEVRDDNSIDGLAVHVGSGTLVYIKAKISADDVSGLVGEMSSKYGSEGI